MKKIFVISAKIFVILTMLFLAVKVYATNEDTFMTGNSVDFKPIEWGISNSGNSAPTPTIVTFNSTTRFIRLQNLSVYADCYADLSCRDISGKRGTITSDSCVVLLPAIGRATPNTVELHFATRNIGFIGSVPTSDKYKQRVHYIATGDSGSF